MIVVVSDVHLGSDVGRKCKGTGHACDDLDLDPLFQTFMGHIGKEYVVGNHDYSIRDMWNGARTKGLFSTMDKSLHLEINGEPFTFIHGHQLEVLANPFNKSEKAYNTISALLCNTAGATGSTASMLWSCVDPDLHGDYMKSMKKPTSERLKGKHNAIDTVEKLAQSKSRSIYTGADGWLVYGHTHRGYVDEMSRTANSGSWGRDDDDSRLDYMIIEDGRPKLCAYEI